MSQKRPTVSRKAVAFLLVSLVLLAGVRRMVTWAAPDRTNFTGSEYIRNGTFTVGLDDWGWDNMTTTDNVGASTDPVLVMKTFLSQGPVNVWQEVFLPTTTTAATLSFDYRLVPANSYAYLGAALGVSVFKTDANFNNPQAITGWWVVPSTTVDTGWQHFSQALTAQEVAQTQAAHQAGERVFINLQLQLGSQDNFQAYIDNVSLLLSGTMTYPSLSGALAYRGVDSNNHYTIGWMSPDGSSRYTLWTHPTAGGGKIVGLSWKADGSAIAFASDHEFGYSPFHTDIYQVDMNGQVRRLTNPPAHSEIQAGGYSKGTVTGRVWNNSTRNLTAISVYVQGADSPVSLGPLAPDATVNFTVPNVADLGAGKGQYVVFIWMDGNCASGLYQVPGALVDVQAGGSVDAGTLSFVGNDCTQFEAAEPAWKPDGSMVAFAMNGVPQKVDMAGTLGSLFSTSALGLNDIAWSPQSGDALLYTANPGVYQTTAGDGTGTLLVDAAATGVGAQHVAWLPDGSGFIFTDGLDLYRYTSASGQIQRLTQLYVYRSSNPNALDPLGALAVSPDGKYAVFERRSPSVVNGRDLWMINLQNPVELWPVTTDGRAAQPDWLAGTPQQPSPTPTSTPSPTPGVLYRVYLPLVLR
ncbi:MAG TPA: hypothetical protein EYP56_22420 [Planctomycetaceae bacterium]|nr:hypothetical protein [Planctomycetaceae bacterium]HIQ20622.1 hypothetical protein [Planctomycetota bacterium]